MAENSQAPRVNRRRRGLRAAWSADEIPPALSADARHRLIQANRGFVVEPRLDDLELELRVLVREPQRMDASVKDRRAELAELARRVQGVRVGLRQLHPRSRHAVEGALIMGWRWNVGELARLREALGTLRMACGQVLAELPQAGGRPNHGRRDEVIRTVVTFVDSLEPTRARAVIRAALSRSAAGQPLSVPLREDRLDRRRLESVKIVCEALGLPLNGDVSRILRRALSKKPT